MKVYKLVEQVEEGAPKAEGKAVPDFTEAIGREAEAREIWHLVAPKVHLENGMVVYSAPPLVGSSFIILIRWIFNDGDGGRPADGLRYICIKYAQF